jgi:hypothetical protein
VIGKLNSYRSSVIRAASSRGSKVLDEPGWKMSLNPVALPSLQTPFFSTFCVLGVLCGEFQSARPTLIKILGSQRKGKRIILRLGTLDPLTTHFMEKKESLWLVIARYLTIA